MEVFCCGAGSMLLGILLLTPVRVRLERLSVASCWMIVALLFIILVVVVDESFMNVLKNRRIIAGSFRF